VKSAVETLNPTRVKLTVEVPFEELKPSLDAAYKRIGSQINVPGFRRGKVPALVIDQRVGREIVVDEAVNEALPKLYTQALQDNNLTPLSQPEVDLGEINDGAQLSFTAELDVKPQIQLPDYTGLAVNVDAIAVGDDEVDEQLEMLRERFGSLTPVDRPAARDDFVTIDLSAAKDGEPIEEAQATGLSYQVGRGTMLDGLDEALEGMSAGEEKSFESKLTGGEFANQPVEVTVKVTSVSEQELPDLDDEFAQQASEFDTVEELRADLHDRLTRGARVEQAAAARDAVLEELLSMVDIPLPDAVVEAELQARRESIDEQLSYTGTTHAAYLESEGQSEEEFGADLEKRVREAIAAQFLLDEIAVAQSVAVSEEDLTQQLMMRAQQSGVTPEQYVQHIMEHNHLPELMAEVRRAKALAQVVENAAVTDAAGDPVELKRLLPDGTYAEPVEDADGGDGEGAPAPAVDAAAAVIGSTDYLVETEAPADE
jgi:trigger factor